MTDYKLEIEDEITNIFITIDNYGTAEEARVDIRKLIEAEKVKARIDELEWVDDKFDSLLQATDDGDRVHPGEFYEAIQDRIKELES